MAEVPQEKQVATVEELQRRITELEQDRDHLLAVVDIMEAVSGSLHFVDILQSITKKLGDLYGLDRCSIFLAERHGKAARLVASYEDPTIRNYLVDLERYPELKRTLRSGEVVFIPDAASDPMPETHLGSVEQTRRKVHYRHTDRVARCSSRRDVPPYIARRQVVFRAGPEILQGHLQLDCESAAQRVSARADGAPSGGNHRASA